MDLRTCSRKWTHSYVRGLLYSVLTPLEVHPVYFRVLLLNHAFTTLFLLPECFFTIENLPILQGLDRTPPSPCRLPHSSSQILPLRPLSSPKPRLPQNNAVRSALWPLMTDSRSPCEPGNCDSKDHVLAFTLFPSPQLLLYKSLQNISAWRARQRASSRLYVDKSSRINPWTFLKCLLCAKHYVMC